MGAAPRQIPSLLEQTPHLREEHANFDQALKQLVVFEHEQEAATARLREATRRRDQQDNRVRLLNNRLVAFSVCHFGGPPRVLEQAAVTPEADRAQPSFSTGKRTP
ncbi:MAG TPA: hypothetical protein VF121_20030 [Thermoanaerobaculia bacterium]|nr:hypothetical protein [Thermoanaerobaculia bacterium]